MRDSKESVAPHGLAVSYFSREYAPGHLLYSVVGAEEVKIFRVHPRSGEMVVDIVEGMSYEEFRAFERAFQTSQNAATLSEGGGHFALESPIRARVWRRMSFSVRGCER